MNTNLMIIQKMYLLKQFFFADSILMKALERHYTDARELSNEIDWELRHNV